MRRRTLLPLVGSASVLGVRFGVDAEGMADGTTLSSAPIEVTGDWAGSLPRSALTVVSRMREVSLAGVRLLSDRQPGALRVENRTSGPPHIWLHFDGTPIAWIVVDIGPRDWSKLAYQFGHELGHVLANSWGPDAKPRNPCQWLEEALVESFSIRGLGLLADSWERDPPFPGNAAFGAAIRGYREDLLTRYRAVAADQGADRGMVAWFAAQRAALETNGAVGGPARGAMPAVVGELEGDPAALDGLCALNRWPGRTGVAMEEYLRLWKKSCADLGVSQRLPIRVRKLLLG